MDLNLDEPIVPVRDDGLRNGSNRSPSTRNRVMMASTASSTTTSRIRSRSHAAAVAAAGPAASLAPGSPLKPHGSRRSHRKVRTGCKNCKERKIKVSKANDESLCSCLARGNVQSVGSVLVVGCWHVHLSLSFSPVSLP